MNQSKKSEKPSLELEEPREFGYYIRQYKISREDAQDPEKIKDAMLIRNSDDILFDEIDFDELERAYEKSNNNKL